MKPVLVSSTNLPEPPYPADTKANGFRQEVDWSRLAQSRTWILADNECRPWLLMLWLQSWANVPVGSWDADDEVIAKSIGCKPEWFAGHRDQLLRGWARHSDGRLYHPFIVTQVRRMIELRKGVAERQKRFRGANKERSDASVTRYSRVSHGHEQEQEQEESTEVQSVCSSQASPVQNIHPSPQLSAATAADPCPHEKIIEIYHRALPMCPRVRTWNQTRRAALRSRWREDPERQDLEWWSGYFAFVNESRFLTGKARAQGDRPPFVADLAWLVAPTNFAKVIEGRYHRG